MQPDVAAKQMTAAYRICVPGMRNVRSTEHGELMSEGENHPGRLLDMLLAFSGAVPGFFIGEVVALLPCFDNVPSPYCSVHGGGAIFVGLVLGLVCAVGGFCWVWRALRSSK
jgi:hypothetical protein